MTPKPNVPGESPWGSALWVQGGASASTPSLLALPTCPFASIPEAFSQLFCSSPAPGGSQEVGFTLAHVAQNCNPPAKNQSMEQGIHVGLYLRLPPGVWLCLGVALGFFCLCFCCRCGMQPGAEAGRGMSHRVGGLGPGPGWLCPRRGNSALAGGVGLLHLHKAVWAHKIHRGFDGALFYRR